MFFFLIALYRSLTVKIKRFLRSDRALRLAVLWLRLQESLLASILSLKTSHRISAISVAAGLAVALAWEAIKKTTELLSFDLPWHSKPAVLPRLLYTVSEVGRLRMDEMNNGVCAASALGNGVPIQIPHEYQELTGLSILRGIFSSAGTDLGIQTPEDMTLLGLSVWYFVVNYALPTSCAALAAAVFFHNERGALDYLVQFVAALQGTRTNACMFWLAFGYISACATLERPPTHARVWNRISSSYAEVCKRRMAVEFEQNTPKVHEILKILTHQSIPSDSVDIIFEYLNGTDTRLCAYGLATIRENQSQRDRRREFMMDLRQRYPPIEGT